MKTIKVESTKYECERCGKQSDITDAIANCEDAHAEDRSALAVGIYVEVQPQGSSWPFSCLVVDGPSREGFWLVEAPDGSRFWIGRKRYEGSGEPMSWVGCPPGAEPVKR